jgi:hypothetical protein
MFAPWGYAISGSATIATTFFVPARVSMPPQRTFSRIQFAPDWPQIPTTGRSADPSCLTGRSVAAALRRCRRFQPPSSRRGRNLGSSGLPAAGRLYAAVRWLLWCGEVAAALRRCRRFQPPSSRRGRNLRSSGLPAAGRLYAAVRWLLWCGEVAAALRRRSVALAVW